MPISTKGDGCQTKYVREKREVRGMRLNIERPSVSGPVGGPEFPLHSDCWNDVAYASCESAPWSLPSNIHRTLRLERLIFSELRDTNCSPRPRHPSHLRMCPFQGLLRTVIYSYVMRSIIVRLGSHPNISPRPLLLLPTQ